MGNVAETMSGIARHLHQIEDKLRYGLAHALSHAAGVFNAKGDSMKGHRICRAICSTAAVAALAAGFTTPAQAKEWSKVTVAFEYHNPPWNYNMPPNEGIEMHGFEPELMANLCQRIKLQCTLTAGEEAELVPGLRKGKFDVLMDGIEIPNRLQKVIDFSKPYTNQPATFLVVDRKILPKPDPNAPILQLTGDPAADKPALGQLRTLLKGKAIGVVPGGAYKKFLDENFKDIATIRTCESPSACKDDLTHHVVDAFIDDVSNFASTMEREASGRPDEPGVIRVHVAGPKIRSPRWGVGEALAFRKEDADLRAKFDAAIAAAIADGTVKKLSEKWFFTDITP